MLIDSAAPEPATELDTGVACLVMLARFHNTAASPEQFTLEYAEDGRLFGRPEILLAAKKLGLKAKSARTSFSRLTQTPLPGSAVDTNGRFFITARLDEGKALIHGPRAQRPDVLTQEALESSWAGELLLIQSEASMAGQLSGFDLTWFIAAIIKDLRLVGAACIHQALKLCVAGSRCHLKFLAFAEHCLLTR